MGRTSDARERLITAATQTLWEFGYHGATVDRICAQAETRKGSFHYFFGSKDVLVRTAIEHAWQERQLLLDTIFSPRKEPIERLRDNFSTIVRRQQALQRLHGRVLGCFFTSLGTQLDGADPEVGARTTHALTTYERYYVSAVCDAAGRRQLEAQDPALAGRTLWSFTLGTLAGARVMNDLAMVEALPPVALAMVGADEQKVRAS